MELNKEDFAFFGIVALIVAVFFYYILGIAGAVSALAIIVVFLIPTYFIMDNFNFDTDEKMVFSFFIGVGIFPAFAYWLGTIMSFKLAIFITFIILIGIGYGIKKFWKKK